MELKYLNTVKTILETGSFQAAAQRLNYTQSTVTFQVRQLERELNVKLFEKIGHRMVMTQAGREIMPYVDKVLDASVALINYGRREPELTGSLKAGFVESLLVYKTPEILKEFRREAPNVQLSLITGNCYEICGAVASGEIDAGLHYNVTKQSPVITTERLAPQPSALVASPELPEEERDFTTPCQVKRTALIYREEAGVYSRLFNEYLLRKNIAFKHNMTIQNIEAAKLCAAGNLGVAFLPRFTAERELAEGSLIELKTEVDDGNIRAMLSYHKNKWISPAMELFVRLVRRKLALRQE